MEDSGKELRLTILYEKEGSEWGHYMRKVCEYDQRLENVEIFPCKIDPWPLNPDDLFQIGLAQCKLLILTEAMLEVEEHVWQELGLVLQPASSVLLFFCGVWSAERLYDVMPESRNWVVTDAEKDTDSIVDFIISMTSLKDEASTISGYEEEESTLSDNTSIDKNEAGEEVTTPTSAVHVEWMNDSTEVMDICHVQPMMVLPEKIWPGIEVYLLLMTRIGEETTLMLTWMSEIDETTHNSKPILVNDYTLRVMAPAIKPGQVWLCLWQEEVLLTQVVVTFTDDLHELECLLRKVTNPISFMCQAFQITPGDVNTLDKLLTDCLRENVPVGGLHLFGITHSEEEEDSSSLIESQEELPTLLHFAARFGLSNVMAQLLQYPGAFQALRTTNKHGLSPSHLAETHGFLELQQFINDYLETGILLKEELWSSITNKGQIDANPEKKKAYEQMIRCTTDKLMRCSLHPGTDDELPSSITRCHSPDSLLECKYLQTNVASCENDMWRYFEDEEENPYIIAVSDVLSPEEKTEHRAGIEAKEEVEEEKEHNTKPVIFEYEFQQHCEDTNNEIYDTIEGCVIPTTEALPPSTPDFQFEPQITKQTPITNVKPQWQVDDVYGSLVMTPGQEQLIHLQEQVKLKNLTIDEALSSFKAWQNARIKKGDSFRSQKENLQKLRQSIARKHKDDGKKGEVEIIHVLDKTIYDSVKGVTSVPSGGLQSIYSTTPIPSNLYGQVSPKCTRGVLKSGHCAAASSVYETNAALLNVYGTMATNRSNYCTMMNLPKIYEMDTSVYSTLSTAARGNNVCLSKPQGGRGSYPRGILSPSDIKERKEEGIYNFALAPPSNKDAATIISDAPPPVAPRPHRTLKPDKKRTIESQDSQPELGPRPNTIAQQLPGRKKKLCPTVSENRMNRKMLSRRPSDPPPPLPRRNQR